MKFLKTSDLSNAEIIAIVDLADELEKKRLVEGYLPPLLRGKSLAMVFDETSLRTRSAFERAMNDLGGDAIHYKGEEARVGIHAKKQEDLRDLANVMGRFNDAILSRIYDYKTQELFCELAPVPFINGMCDLHHPTQSLCDMLTITRQFGKRSDLKIAFFGDVTNVTYSVVEAANAFGIKVVISSPAAYKTLLERFKTLKNCSFESDPFKAVDGAHIVMSDSWFPMNCTESKDERSKNLEPYRVTTELMRAANEDAVFMHNLPAIRGEEVEAAVIEGPQSIVYDEAVSRLHIARALLIACFIPNWSKLKDL